MGVSETFSNEDYTFLWAKMLNTIATVECETFEKPCLLMTKGFKPRGYCDVTYKSKRKMAHVFAWEMFHNNCQEPSDLSMKVAHLCPNKNCVEASHLQLMSKRTIGMLHHPSNKKPKL